MYLLGVKYLVKGRQVGGRQLGNPEERGLSGFVHDLSPGLPKARCLRFLIPCK